MQGRELRQKYIEFFQSKGCLHLPSDSLVPNDPSLLFTAAGMVQFKPYFTGAEVPPHTRAVTAQKCLRTDDIDEVGDAVHHTFFEMMGNFSFGDYFKREAIHWAWEFLTKVLQLPEDRIWTSVYLDDDEAATIWADEVKLPAGRIVRLGADKNYWPPNAPEKGPNGPCGPCNEIFLDIRPELGVPEDPAHAIAYDSNRFVEMWNLVFIQFLRGEDGSLTPLPKKNIDTGLGLERVTAILQGAKSDYETDLFYPLIQDFEKLSGTKYGQDDTTDNAIRTVADHCKAAVFCIADGVMPSNVKRGYVLRRMIRRSAVKARSIGYEGELLSKLAPTVGIMMADVYPEISDRMPFIIKVLQSEEDKFSKTLSTGLIRLEEEIKAAKSAASNSLSGEAAFTLYDTFGFPLELTEEICSSSGLTIDLKSYNSLMEEQRKRAREGTDMSADLFSVSGGAFAELQQSLPKTEFVGYQSMECNARILGIIRDGEPVSEIAAGECGQVILDTTPFYAESGGQVGDTGTIVCKSGEATVSDTTKTADIWLHKVVISNGKMAVGDKVQATVDKDRRLSIMRNHTATHLLHAALRNVVGTHVTQAGSLVAPDRLRFDFSHFQSMTPDEISRVEDEVNRNILADFEVSAENTTLKDAREKGAMALFGEKYGDDVRIIQVADVSLELCGGTHLQRTAKIGFMKILSESSVAAGVRRIEAVTGQCALEWVKSIQDTLSQASSLLQSPTSELVTAIERLKATIKEQEAVIQTLQNMSSSEEASALAESAIDIDGFKAVCARSKVGDSDALSRLADQISDKIGSGVVVLGSEFDGKALFVAKVSKDLLPKGLHAGNIVKLAATETGGGGGGRPDFAKAGGKDTSKLDQALNKALDLIKQTAG